MTACSRPATGPAAEGPYRIGTFRISTFNLEVPGEPPASVTGAIVSDAFFQSAKMRLLLGRVFLADEYRPDRTRVVIISHSLWQKSFGSDPAIIGRKIRLNSEELTVIGIMPGGFPTPHGAELWIPLPS